MAGFSPLQTVRYVQVPQMLVIILPTLANMIVILAKETAVLSVITVNEMTSVVSGIGSTTYAYAETLAVSGPVLLGPGRGHDLHLAPRRD